MTARAVQNPTKIEDKIQRTIMQNSILILMRINAIIEADAESEARGGGKMNIPREGYQKIILEGINTNNAQVTVRDLYVTSEVYTAWDAYQNALKNRKDGSVELSNLATAFVNFAETNGSVRDKVKNYEEDLARLNVLTEINKQPNNFDLKKSFEFNAEEQQETVAVILGRLGVGGYKHLKLKKITEAPKIAENFFLQTENGQVMPITQKELSNFYNKVHTALLDYYNMDELGKTFLENFEGTDVNFLLDIRKELESVSRKDNPAGFTSTQGLVSFGLLAASLARQWGSIDTEFPIHDTVFGYLPWTVAFVPLALTGVSYFAGSLNFSGSESMQHFVNEIDPRKIIERLEKDATGVLGGAKESFKTITQAYHSGKKGSYETIRNLYQIVKSSGKTDVKSLVSDLSSLAWKSFVSSTASAFQLLSGFLSGALNSVVHLLEFADFLFLFRICMASGDPVTALGEIAFYLATVFLRKNAVEGCMTALTWTGMKRTSSWFYFVRTALNYFFRLFFHFPAGFFSNPLNVNDTFQYSRSLFENIFSLNPIKGTQQAAADLWNAVTGPVAVACKYINQFWSELGLSKDITEKLLGLWNTITSIFSKSEVAEYTEFELLGTNTTTLQEVLGTSSFPITDEGYKNFEVAALFDPVCTVVKSTVKRTPFFETPWSILTIPIGSLPSPLERLQSALQKPSPTLFESLALLFANDSKYISYLEKILGGEKVERKIIDEMVKYGKNEMKRIASLSNVEFIKSHCSPEVANEAVWKVFFVASARVVHTMKDSERFSDIFRAMGDTFKNNIRQIFIATGSIQFASDVAKEITTMASSAYSWSFTPWANSTFSDRLLAIDFSNKLADPNADWSSWRTAIMSHVGVPSLPTIAVSIAALWAAKYAYQIWTKRSSGTTKGLPSSLSMLTKRPVTEDPDIFVSKKQGRIQEEEEDYPAVLQSEEPDLSTQAANYQDQEFTEAEWLAGVKSLVEFAYGIELSINSDETAHLLICRTASRKYMQILRAVLDTADEDAKSRPEWRYMYAQTNPALQYTPNNLEPEDETESLKSGPSLDQHLFDTGVFDTDRFTIDHVEAAYRVFLGKQVSESNGDEDDNYMRQRLSLFIDAVLLDRLLSLPIP